MDLNFDEFRALIYTKLVRAKRYLQEYNKELPRYLMTLYHKIEHPLSSIHILLQQLSRYSDFEDDTLLTPSKIGITNDLSFFDLALNELRTILDYLTEREREPIFQEIENHDLEQRLKLIIQNLEDIKKIIK